MSQDHAAARPEPRTGAQWVDRDERSRRTAELFARADGADDSERRRLLEEVVLTNRGVAQAIANRYARKGLPPEDLLQVAYEGLVKAVHRFDPTTRNDLLSYAVPTIRGELLRYFRDHGWVVRPPRHLQEMRIRVNQCREQLEDSLGRTPTTEEIAAEAGCSVDDCREALSTAACFSPTSLDREIGHDTSPGTTLADWLPGPVGAADEDAAEARVMLAPALARLAERDRRILRLRYIDGLTQREIGTRLGITQTQVSKLISRILDDLRSELGDTPEDVLRETGAAAAPVAAATPRVPGRA